MSATIGSRASWLIAALAAASLIVGPLAHTASAATGKEKALRKKINTFRAKHDRKPLKMAPKLVKPAHKHAKVMAADGVFNPATDHSTGAQLLNYAQDAGCWSLAEIIASTIGTGNHILNTIMKQWKGSPDHKGIMLEKKWKKIGTGVFKDGKGRLWAVALFCSPG
jgi:uncharacterized protein YkwD